jgi:hypothetical protein
MDVTLCLSPFCRRDPFWGNLADINERIDQWFWRWSISLHSNLVVEHGEDSLTRNSEGKMNFWGMGCRRFYRRVSLSIGVQIGEPGEGVQLQGAMRDRGKKAPEMEHLSLWELCQGNLKA